MGKVFMAVDLSSVCSCKSGSAHIPYLGRIARAAS